MRSSSIRGPASFGKRKEPSKIIVVRNGRERQFSVHPTVFSAMVGMVFMFLFGYFGATAYLVFRDDLIAARYASQARMQHAYEDRIAALRSKLDRVTSRQLLDQQALAMQVQELMERQEVIGSRGGALRDVLNEAEKRGLDSAAAVRDVPAGDGNAASTAGKTKQAGDRASLDGSIHLFTPHLSGGSRFAMQDAATAAPTMAGTPNPQMFNDMARAIGMIDTHQRQKVDQIRIAAAKRTEKIGKVLTSIGVQVGPSKSSGIGGPFEPIAPSAPFEAHIEALEATLKTYDSVSETAKSIPLGAPVPGAKVSSRFGTRVDPFNGRIAMHNGIDFRAKRGTPVKAAGDGTVAKAGRNGGYGKVVEIRHANGYVTRYAHLSKILVKPGQSVSKGQAIGKVGSTGRSTGPHLHYEVRRSDSARDPSKYIRAGYQIRGLL